MRPTQPTPCPFCGAPYGHHPDCPTNSHSTKPNILSLEQGCDTTRKSHQLSERIKQIIEEPFFEDMTMAEVIGVLEIEKQRQILRMV